MFHLHLVNSAAAAALFVFILKDALSDWWKQLPAGTIDPT
jgi:hypothetical protein